MPKPIIKITRTSSRGLVVRYDSTYSKSGHVSIGWQGGYSRVAMSVEHAHELQRLLSDVLDQVPPPP